MDWLISIGRGLVLWCAVLIIVVNASLGCILGGAVAYSTVGPLIILGPFSTTPYPLIGLVIGAIVGLLTAGAVFGVVAAIFDMQRSLRHLATVRGLDAEDNGQPTIPQARREPSLSR